MGLCRSTDQLPRNPRPVSFLRTMLWGSLWDDVRDAAPPPSLARKLGMFSARAIVPLNDHESFQEQSWAALLNGCGVAPQGYDPRLDALPNDEHVERVQQRLRSVAMLARQMPTVDQFLGLDQPSAALVGS